MRYWACGCVLWSGILLGGCATGLPPALKPLPLSTARLGDRARLSLTEFLRRNALTPRNLTTLRDRLQLCGVICYKNGEQRQLVISYVGLPVPTQFEVLQADGNYWQLPLPRQTNLERSSGLDHELVLSTADGTLPEHFGDTPLTVGSLMDDERHLSTDTLVWTFDLKQNGWAPGPDAALLKQWSDFVCENH